MNSENVTLRPLEDSDLEQLSELLNDSHNQHLVGGSVYPMSKSQVFEWLQAKRKAADTCQFAIEKSSQFSGYIQLVAINCIDGHAILGINLLSRFRGQGIGGMAIKKLHEFAKCRLLLRKIILYVRSDNDSARNLYLRSGYQVAGTLVRHVRCDGGYVDVNIMEVLL